MITYTNLAWIGDDQTLFHAVDLTVDDVNYGTQIIGKDTDVGRQLLQYINDNNIVLPIEETGEHEENLTDDIVYNRIRDYVQLMLDRKAQEKNYDNGFALSTYANSTIPSFKEEALKYIKWRDECWMICYDLLEKYQSGEIERPTVDSVSEALPVLEW